MVKLLSLRRLLAVLAAVATLAAGAASAATVSVSGGSGATGVNIGPNFDAGAVAIQFTLDADIHDFEIAVTGFCIRCKGGFWLQRNSIGPSAPIPESLGATAAEDLLGLLTSRATVFSGSNLTAGTYFLIFTVTEGTGGWLTGAPPALTEEGGSVGYMFTADTANVLGYRSDFAITLSRSVLPEFSVTGTSGGDLAPVPLPASMWMVLVGLLVLAGLSRGRRV